MMLNATSLCAMSTSIQSPSRSIATWGGITIQPFWNSYPSFTNTNDLSLVAFIKYANFKILFPGDLELAGWQALLQRQDFRDRIGGYGCARRFAMWRCTTSVSQ